MLNIAVHEILQAFISEKDFQENNGRQPVREVNCIQRQRAFGISDLCSIVESHIAG